MWEFVFHWLISMEWFRFNHHYRMFFSGWFVMQNVWPMQELHLKIFFLIFVQEKEVYSMVEFKRFFFEFVHLRETKRIDWSLICRLQIQRINHWNLRPMLKFKSIFGLELKNNKTIFSNNFHKDSICHRYHYRSIQILFNIIVWIIRIHSADISICFLGKSLYELRCHCYRARSLMALDDTGLSDPFLSITAGNETQTTPVNFIFFFN